MNQQSGYFEEEIFRDEQAYPLSDHEAFLIMHKAKESAQEGLNQSDHPLLKNMEFLEFLRYQERMILSDKSQSLDQISREAQLLREKFNQLSELSNTEISLFLTLKPQTFDEAVALIPSLN